MNMLRSIRERKGLTVGQLAARASIPTRVLTEYEEGRQPIPLPHAKILAKALWVRIEDLLPAANSTSQVPQPAASQPAPPRYTPAQPPPRPQVTEPQSPYPPRPSGPPPAPTGTAHGPQSQGTGGQGAPMMRPANGTPHPGGPPPRRGPEGQGQGGRPPRPAPSPPKPITEGQVEELLRLAGRLEMEQARVEQEMGKSVQALTRTEAKDWIKKYRDMTDESSPGSRVRFGQWPGQREDHEASYLDQYRQTNTPFAFKMFNSEEFRGTISDFTPYTITIKANSGGDVVLRKLAIAYYRQIPEGEQVIEGEKPKKSARASKSRAAAAKEQPDEHHQPLSNDLGSDHVGEPTTPEADSMDEDRGV